MTSRDLERSISWPQCA